MSGTIAEWLVDTGILQFGYFVIDRKIMPVRFCPEYFPAYPQLLAEVAKLVLLAFDVSQVDHLIVTVDSVPLGITCSLQTGLSLVYSRGRGEAAVYDLVGSYNSGHLSALLMNSVEDAVATRTFISNASGVGLETRAIVTLVEMRPVSQLAEIPVRSVFRLADIVRELATSGRLPDGQAQAVLKWIREN